ncbi:MAG: cytochrome c biogenesis protein CcsA [Planctomycetaceae bacterium]|nr:cytochrome c biogenesis protein CcsA [Planctomycetaceae bacterium]
MLSQLESMLLHGGILACTIAALLALLGLFWPKRFGLAPTNVTTAAAFLAFLGYFLSRFVTSGAVPLANVFEVMLLIASGLILGYFIVLLKRPHPALAAWVLPMAGVILFAALPLGSILGPASVDTERSDSVNNPLILAHVVLAIMATVHFAFAFLVASMFLLQDRALKLKRDSVAVRALPPLEVLERMVFAGVAGGFAMLTLALGLGFAAEWDDLGAWLTRPKVIASLAMWLVFLMVVAGRYNHRFRGRREMYLVMTGFLIVIIVYAYSATMAGGT